MNLVSIYSRRPGFGWHWTFLRNVPEDGQSLSSILRKEITSSPWAEDITLVPFNPGDMPVMFGSPKNPMIDQIGGAHCAIPYKPYEWWQKKAVELDGTFEHDNGLPVVRVVKLHFIDNLLNV